jgi:hypothetical protein
MNFFSRKTFSRNLFTRKNLFSRKTTGLFRRCMTLSSKSKFSLPIDLLSRRFEPMKPTGDLKVLRLHDKQPGMTWSEIKQYASRLHNAKTVRRNWYIKCLQQSSVIPHMFFALTGDGKHILVPSFKIHYDTSRIVFDLKANKVLVDELEWQLYRRYLPVPPDDKHPPLIYENGNGYTILTPDETAFVMKLKEDGYEHKMGNNYVTRIRDGCFLVKDSDVIPIYKGILTTVVPPKDVADDSPITESDSYYYDPLHHPTMFRKLNAHDYPNTRKKNNEYLFNNFPIFTILLASSSERQGRHSPVKPSHPKQQLSPAEPPPPNPPQPPPPQPPPPQPSAPEPPQPSPAEPPQPSPAEPPQPSPAELQVKPDVSDHIRTREDAIRDRRTRKIETRKERRLESLRIKTRQVQVGYAKYLTEVDKNIGTLRNPGVVFDKLTKIIDDKKTSKWIHSRAENLLRKVGIRQEKLWNDYLNDVEDNIKNKTLLNNKEVLHKLTQIIVDKKSSDAIRHRAETLRSQVEEHRDVPQPVPDLTFSAQDKEKVKEVVEILGSPEEKYPDAIKEVVELLDNPQEKYPDAIKEVAEVIAQNPNIKPEDIPDKITNPEAKEQIEKAEQNIADKLDQVPSTRKKILEHLHHFNIPWRSLGLSVLLAAGRIGQPTVEPIKVGTVSSAVGDFGTARELGVTHRNVGFGTVGRSFLKPIPRASFQQRTKGSVPDIVGNRVNAPILVAKINGKLKIFTKDGDVYKSGDETLSVNGTTVTTDTGTVINEVYPFADSITHDGISYNVESPLSDTIEYVSLTRNKIVFNPLLNTVTYVPLSGEKELLSDHVFGSPFGGGKTRKHR